MCQHWVVFHFFTFFLTNFRNQNKNNVVETSSCFIDQLSKIMYIAYTYYVSEHLRYCTQINEYWLNKKVCLYIVLMCWEISTQTLSYLISTLFETFFFRKRWFTLVAVMSLRWKCWNFPLRIYDKYFRIKNLISNKPCIYIKSSFVLLLRR